MRETAISRVNSKSCFAESVYGQKLMNRLFMISSTVMEQAVWSLLLASGYLKVLSYEKYKDIPEGTEPKVSAGTYESGSETDVPSNDS